LDGGRVPPEPPDIGVAKCPVTKLDVELKFCAMRRKTAIKYLSSGKPYQCWQCATCPEGRRAVELMKDYYRILKNAEDKE
jgi:hypothetical protein